jgi:tetrahydromethanopterin S-methyltransferase subunit B
MCGMRRRTGRFRTLSVLALLVLAATPAWAQQDAAVTVEQRVELLRGQLRDVTDKQAQLQARAQELDESLKPENIERSVSGIGTTDASALRDRRREQLEREKAVVDEQLRSLDASRTRLDASIASAEAEAVRLRASALGTNNSTPRDNNAAATPAPAASPSTPAKQNGRRTVKRRKRVRARRAPSR